MNRWRTWKSSLRTEIRAELHLLRGRSGTTMIEVTHDPVEALSLGQRLAVLRDGTVEQVGPPAELYDRPRPAPWRRLLAVRR